MREKYDTEGFPVMRFFSYDIPQTAINDLIHGRLSIVASASFRVVDTALAESGFTVAGVNSESTNDGYPYSVKIGWPTGEDFLLQLPSSQVSREVERALYEFSGLDDVVRKVSSVRLIPNTISYQAWDASLRAKEPRGSSTPTTRAG